MLSIRNDEVQSINVGDSRVYIFRNGNLEQISEDHSIVYRMYLNGILTKEDVRTHIRSNEIYQYLGNNSSHEKITAFVSPKMQVQTGDVYIVCSDGLTDMLPESEI